MGTYILKLSATEIYTCTVDENGMIVAPSEGFTLADGSYKLYDVTTGNPRLGFDVKDGKQVGTVYGLNPRQILFIPANDTVVLPKGYSFADGVYTVSPYGTFEVRNGAPTKLRFYDKVFDPLDNSDDLGSPPDLISKLLSLLSGESRWRDIPQQGKSLRRLIEDLVHIDDSISVVEGKPLMCGHIHSLKEFTLMERPQFIHHIGDEIEEERRSPLATILPLLLDASEADLLACGLHNKTHVEHIIACRERVLAWKPPTAPTAETGGESAPPQ